MAGDIRTMGDMVAEQRPDGIWDVRWKSGSGRLGAVKHLGDEFVVEHVSGQRREGFGTFDDALMALWEID